MANPNIAMSRTESPAAQSSHTVWIVETPAKPCSSRSRSKIRYAVCRCLRGTSGSVSASSCAPRASRATRIVRSARVPRDKDRALRARPARQGSCAPRASRATRIVRSARVPRDKDRALRARPARQGSCAPRASRATRIVRSARVPRDKDRVDDAGEPVQLRPPHRLRPAIARRRRIAQHLLHRPPVDAEPPARLVMTQTLIDNRQTNRRIELHAVHPPPLATTDKGP